MNVKSLLKTLPKKTLLIILCVIMSLVMIYSFSLRIKASSVGKRFGTEAGTATGVAIGSAEGLHSGISAGATAGQQAGLSAEDTQAIITSRIHEMENLEVLVASVKLKNFHTIGDNVDYAALYLVNGDVVFTVDLGQADIDEKAGRLQIKLPKPKGKLYIDNSSVEKIGEYQKKFFNGNSEAGYDAYINTMKQLHDVSEENLTNYNELLYAAQDAAKTQITQLVNSASLLNSEPVIEWMEDGGETS